MKILKFGSATASDAANIRQAASIVREYTERQVPLLVVFSGIFGVTEILRQAGQRAASRGDQHFQLLEEVRMRHSSLIDQLFGPEAAHPIHHQTNLWIEETRQVLESVRLLGECSARTIDLLESLAERLPTYIACAYFRQEQIDATFVDTRNLIRTDQQFGHAQVDLNVTEANIRLFWQRTRGQVPVLTGCTGCSERGEATKLGKAGSDYTAAILAYALQAEEVEIWTNERGIMSADAQVVQDAQPLAQLSFGEMMEFAHFGAKIVYPPVFGPLVAKNIPLRIRNIFDPAFEGTYVSLTPVTGSQMVRGISSIRHTALLSISGTGMIGMPGMASRIFSALARRNISVILITQASSEHSIGLALSPSQAFKAKEALEEELQADIRARRIDPVRIDYEQSILSVIGAQLRSTPGIAALAFRALARNAVNIKAIAQGGTETNLSMVVAQTDYAKALTALHCSLGLSAQQPAEVFWLGEEEMCRQTHAHWAAQDPDIRWRWQGAWTQAAEAVSAILSKNLAYSLLADLSHQPEACRQYPALLQKGVEIRTANTSLLACSVPELRHWRQIAARLDVRIDISPLIGIPASVLEAADALLRQHPRPALISLHGPDGQTWPAESSSMLLLWFDAGRPEQAPPVTADDAPAPVTVQPCLRIRLGDQVMCWGWGAIL